MRKLQLLLGAAALILPALLPAQSRTYWRIPSAVGGAFIGTGVGWMLDVARWEPASCGLCGPTLTTTPIGMAIGGAAGFIGGLAADRRLARGDSLPVAARRWLRVAAFLTPPAIGSLGAFLIINPSDEPECVPDGSGGCTYREREKFMSDESAAMLGIGGGALAGWLLQNKTKGALRPRVTAGTGSLGLSFTYAF
jgi:hypothetical protein